MHTVDNCHTMQGSTAARLAVPAAHAAVILGCQRRDRHVSRAGRIPDEMYHNQQQPWCTESIRTLPLAELPILLTDQQHAQLILQHQLIAYEYIKCKTAAVTTKCDSTYIYAAAALNTKPPY